VGGDWLPAAGKLPPAWSWPAVFEVVDFRTGFGPAALSAPAKVGPSSGVFAAFDASWLEELDGVLAVCPEGCNTREGCNTGEVAFIGGEIASYVPIAAGNEVAGNSPGLQLNYPPHRHGRAS
jgi:hypothetical protein